MVQLLLVEYLTAHLNGLKDKLFSILQEMENHQDNRGVIDPTANVLSLVEAANKRQDDLRIAEARRVDEQMELRAYYTEKLADAEAKRLDAIRLVDVGAVSLANEKAGAQAAVLAKQVSESALALSLTAGAKGVSTPLLLSIAAIAGGLISFVIQRILL